MVISMRKMDTKYIIKQKITNWEHKYSFYSTQNQRKHLKKLVSDY